MTKQDKADRLAAALRENLRRRKAQRREAESPLHQPSPPDAAGSPPPAEED